MDLLGINRRNKMIADVNSRRSIALANDKVASKAALTKAGVRVPETLMTIKGLSDIAIADFADLPESFVVKPNKGSKGLGIVVLHRQRTGTWKKGDDTWSETDLKEHLNRIFTGNYSNSGAHRDTAFLEELVTASSVFEEVGAHGLPDIRVICFEQKPIQAMLRLPTKLSGGKANLHRGAVGMAIDPDTGRCTRAWHDNREVSANPATGEALIGFEIPKWPKVLEEAAKASRAIDLNYCGTDSIITAEDEVATIEVNAFPGIEIQNVNKTGLRSLLPYRTR